MPPITKPWKKLPPVSSAPMPPESAPKAIVPKGPLPTTDCQPLAAILPNAPLTKACKNPEPLPLPTIAKTPWFTPCKPACNKNPPASFLLCKFNYFFVTSDR